MQNKRHWHHHASDDDDGDGDGEGGHAQASANPTRRKKPNTSKGKAPATSEEPLAISRTLIPCGLVSILKPMPPALIDDGLAHREVEVIFKRKRVASQSPKRTISYSVMLVAKPPDGDPIFSYEMDASAGKDSDPILYALFEAWNDGEVALTGGLHPQAVDVDAMKEDDNAWDLHQVWLHGGPAPLLVSGLLLQIMVHYRALPTTSVLSPSKTMNALLDLLYPPSISVSQASVVKHLMMGCVPEMYPTQEFTVQPQGLLPVLHPFQRRAVSWMLEREGVTLGKSGKVRTRSRQAAEPPLFCSKIRMPGEGEFYVNRLTGRLATIPMELLCDNVSSLYGGILADEMGLGKTIEILALVLLHRWSIPSNPPMAPHEFKPACYSPSGTLKETPVSDLISSGATLIITPVSIMSQWVAEVTAHAPSLRCFCYQGFKDHPNDFNPKSLLSFDIVITTYDVLRAELYLAKEDNNRSRRAPRVYERRKSPLVQIKWWRVCLDEAQMVESTVANASEMARLIPRVHPWCVTGTPLPHLELSDIEGLLTFLGVEPFSSRHFFQRLLNPTVIDHSRILLASIMHRNTKAMVASDLRIPPQVEGYVGLEFSAVERRYYDDLFEQCCSELLEMAGGSQKEIERKGIAMRSWFLQLRQTCCHPQVGERNKKLLGGSLKSIDEVLKLMHYQCESSIGSLERQLVHVRIQRAQIFELQKNFEPSLEIYKSCLSAIGRSISQLSAIVSRLPEPSDPLTGTEELPESQNSSIQTEETQHRAALTAWRELEHQATFFLACCYHSLKQREEEDHYYREAELIRQDILKIPRTTVCRLQENLKDVWTEDKAGRMLVDENVEIPARGIVGRSLLEEVKRLAWCLRDQWKDSLMVWRGKIFDYLLSSLEEEVVDEDGSNVDTGQPSTEGIELTTPKKDNYATNLDKQSELDIYMDMYSDALQDRRYLITGISFPVPKRPMTSDLIKSLNKERNQYVSPKNAKTHLSFLLKELKAKIDGVTIEMERAIIAQTVIVLTKRIEVEAEALEVLQRFVEIPLQNFKNTCEAHAIIYSELTSFRRLANARIDYFRHLQRLSDHVSPPEPKSGEALEHEGNLLVAEERQVSDVIGAQRRRLNYLTHLRREQNGEETGAVRDCVICRSGFGSGFVTFCGHLYCSECTRFWVLKHSKCAVCNQPVKKNQVVSVSFRHFEDPATNSGGKKLGTDVTAAHVSTTEKTVTSTSGTPIVAPPDFQPDLLKTLQQIPTKGSFGTKIDTLLKHLLYLRADDPTCKALIFSQWDQVLNILSAALQFNSIAFVRMEGGKKSKEAVRRFKEDPDIQVFMLHAKSQSSGLTLVNATHVFLVEPVLNSGLEVQAVGRVHRIGQTKVTHVHRYAVLDTVEERIVGVVRDRKGCGQGGVAKLHYGSHDWNAVDALDSNSLAGTLPKKRAPIFETLKHGGGEAVKDRDLHWCLFGETLPEIKDPTPPEIAPEETITPVSPLRDSVRDDEEEVGAELPSNEHMDCGEDVGPSRRSGVGSGAMGVRRVKNGYIGGLRVR
ncbi:hypothetical protein HDU67_007260 [Dinochytrium kinnereticum]|nr:hypothetical protein HDU67_007260 [Dinochytrium kinnereticum]